MSLSIPKSQGKPQKKAQKTGTQPVEWPPVTESRDDILREASVGLLGLSIRC